MDLLEHLARPEVLLGECRRLLKPQGQILISEPNVANITVRLSLLFGRFEYTDRGILDKTHLHLYTRKSARRLIEAAGFEILRQKTTIMPLELALRIPATSPLMKLANLLLKVLTAIMPGLLGYQCIFVARPNERSITHQTPRSAPGLV
jgi:SAM-dependent methyltransferase